MISAAPAAYCFLKPHSSVLCPSEKLHPAYTGNRSAFAAPVHSHPQLHRYSVAEIFRGALYTNHPVSYLNVVVDLNYTCYIHSVDFSERLVIVMSFLCVVLLLEFVQVPVVLHQHFSRHPVGHVHSSVFLKRCWLVPSSKHY